MGMQSGFSRFVPMFLAILFITASVNVSVAAFDEGDLCWTVRVTDTKEGAVTNPTPMLTKFHIKSIDTTTFAVTATTLVPGDNPAISTGTASSIGTKIIANLVTTQDHRIGDLWRDAGIMRATIDSTTLRGTFFSIEQSFNRKYHTFDDEDYYSGTLTPRACP